MARIQTLLLPGPADSHDFALVVDQATPAEMDVAAGWSSLRDQLGARGVIIAAGTLDVA